MARHKDLDWSMPAPITHTEQASLAVLMDLRDELKEIKREMRVLNAVFACPNFVAVPRILRNISRNTAKPKRKAAKKRARP